MRTHKHVVRHVAPPRIVDVDPEDPLQELDETDGLLDVEVDAMPSEEAIEDLDAAIAAAPPEPDEPDDDTDSALSAPEHLEGFRDSTLGEHFFEMLDARATESGPAPEQPVEIEDNEVTGRYFSRSDIRDRPIADKGAGGPAGR